MHLHFEACRQVLKDQYKNPNWHKGLAPEELEAKVLELEAEGGSKALLKANTFAELDEILNFVEEKFLYNNQ